MASCAFVLLFLSLGSALSILLSMDIQAWSRIGRRNHVHSFCYSLSNPKFSLYLQTFTTTGQLLAVFIVAERFQYPQARILSVGIGAWDHAHSFLLLAFKSLIEVVIFVAQLPEFSTVPQTPLATFTVFSSPVSTVSHRNLNPSDVCSGVPFTPSLLLACLQTTGSTTSASTVSRYPSLPCAILPPQNCSLPLSSKNEDRARHGTASYMTTFTRHRHRCRIAYRRTYIRRRALRYRHSAEERGDVLHGGYFYVTGGYQRMDS
ncbi:hypothetical protein BDQ17DRAFT_1369163 [Cyathus striatus]|nr:hypothetical protein BDQ17DRAFT_1369163 [Cyathus striatus]